MQATTKQITNMKSKYFILVATAFIAISCKIKVASDFDINDVYKGSPTFKYSVNENIAQDGKIIKVTNLKNYGFGSLRWAIEQEGSRRIEFAVGGVIDLEMENLKVRNPYLSIKGETAPSPGITIIKGGLRIETHDVKVTHLKIRPGDAFQQRRSGWKPDAITISGQNTKNIIIDNCSLTWAVDEIIGINTKQKSHTKKDYIANIIIRNSIISEALNDSSHPEGEHSKGILVYENIQGVTIENNLMSHNMYRNPYIKENTKTIVRGNIIYNPGKKAIHFSDEYYNSSHWEGKFYPFAHVTAVDNILIPGFDSNNNLDLISGKGIVYEENNRNLLKSQKKEKKEYFSLKEINVSANQKEYRYHQELDFCKKIREIGARPWDTDSIDLRILQDVLKRTGKIIDSQEQVGGYPSHENSKCMNECKKFETEERNRSGIFKLCKDQSKFQI